MTEICLCARETDTHTPCPLPCTDHSRRQSAAPSLGNGTVLQAILEAQIRAKKNDQQSTFGARRGALWDADPPGCGRGCVDYFQQQNHSLLEPLQRQELFNLKIGKYVGPNPWGQANICFYIMLVHLQLGLWTYKWCCWWFSRGKEVKIKKSRKARPDSVRCASSQIPEWLLSQCRKKQQSHRDVILGSIPLSLIHEVLESDDRLFEAWGNITARNIITLPSCVWLTDHVGKFLGCDGYEVMT